MLSFFAKIHRDQPALSFAGSVLAVSVPGLLLLAAFDSRTLLGEDLWMKPLKFSLAFSVYLWTLAWMLSHASGPLWAKRTIAWLTVVILPYEGVWITLQAARGVRSHFNEATLLDAALFNAVGVGIHVQALLAVWLLVLLLRPSETLSPLRLAAVRLGLLVFLAGLIPGEAMLVLGAHTVGAPDGGPGAPITGWSTAAGDLRIAHFLGMHALQIFPLTAFLLEHWGNSLAPRRRLAWWSSLAAAYIILTSAAFFHALAGQPWLRLAAATP
ncbi:MAG: hypothetical protein KY475_04180 [Planctomycetes bacterium]|nr:hypothetical protein [Planctomycetota bacterium]